MYNDINTEQLNRAGQYSLSDVQLVSYQSSQGQSNPKRISVRSLVTELNIYESLTNKTLSAQYRTHRRTKCCQSLTTYRI